MLSHFLISELFAFLLIFCRLGAAFMLLPGFGEAYVTPRARLLIALMFSLVLTPTLSNLPPVPDATFSLVTLLLTEILIGLFMGMITRFLITALHIAGSIIAYQSSLASALTPDISQAQGQDTSISNMLTVSAVVLLFATDLHHVMIKGLADSYNLFTPGQLPLIHDMANMATQRINGAFRMALQLAAPQLVIGLVLYLTAGIIARLMPNIQIFFILLPAQLLLSFCVMMIIFSALMLWYIDYFRESAGAFLAP